MNDVNTADQLVVRAQKNGNAAAGSGQTGVSGDSTLISKGLTKRELFAAMAMQAVRSVNPSCNSYEIAQSAVADADALLKELAK